MMLAAQRSYMFGIELALKVTLGLFVGAQYYAVSDIKKGST